MVNYQTKDVNINTIKIGDVIEHNGKLQTVCKADIKRDGFMGTTLFGDSYNINTKPVKVLVLTTWNSHCIIKSSNK